jgi:hypothetical protein
MGSNSDRSDVCHVLPLLALLHLEGRFPLVIPILMVVDHAAKLACWPGIVKETGELQVILV